MAFSLALSGCGGEFPAVTDEEFNDIGMYAARILLKYDAGNRSRLVSLEEVEAWELKQQKRREAAAAAAAAARQQDQGMDPVDDTQTTDHSQNVIGGDSDLVMYQSLQDYWQLPAGVQITYTGFDYGSSVESDFLFLDASPGKQLVKLYFDITNQSAESQLVDIIGLNTGFVLNLNGGYRRSALKTMLMDDLATYKKTMEAGESSGAVLVFEIDDSKVADMSAATLNLKNDSKSYTIQLN